MTVLTVDVGGSNIKILASGETERRKTRSGPDLTPAQMVEKVVELAGGWQYDRVSVGYPGVVKGGRPALEPVNLGGGWCGFDFEAAFGKPVKVVNDALLQAIGSYEGGRMLFLGLGTGMGSALVVENVGQPLELGHLPYRKGRTFEQCVGAAGLKRMGRKRWCAAVHDAVTRIRLALQPEYVVIGGGNVSKLKDLPPGCRRGTNANAFLGGFRLWEDDTLVV